MAPGALSILAPFLGRGNKAQAGKSKYEKLETDDPERRQNAAEGDKGSSTSAAKGNKGGGNNLNRVRKEATQEEIDRLNNKIVSDESR